MGLDVQAGLAQADLGGTLGTSGSLRIWWGCPVGPSGGAVRWGCPVGPSGGAVRWGCPVGPSGGSSSVPCQSLSDGYHSIDATMGRCGRSPRGPPTFSSVPCQDFPCRAVPGFPVPVFSMPCRARTSRTSFLPCRARIFCARIFCAVPCQDFPCRRVRAVP